MPPSNQSPITPDITQTLEAFAQEIERVQSLPPNILAIIHSQRWFQLMVPKAVGGLERSLPETVAIFEALASVEANTAWCVNLGAGANMFAGYFAPQVAQTIFSSPQTCIAGSGAISGTALPVDGGYRVSGHWKYASGANHATHFTANAQLLDAAGQRRSDAQGQPLFRSFLFDATDVVNLGNWDAIGLRGTTSNDFTVEGIFVPHAHTFSLLEPSGFAQGPLYRFPFDLLAVVNMASMQTGICRHFLRAFKLLASTKTPLYSTRKLAEHPTAQRIVAQHEQAFEEARTRMFTLLEEAWQKVDEGLALNPELHKSLQQVARQAAWNGKALVDALYPLCGMGILRPPEPLNKIWRDACTASQHYLLSPLQA